MKRLKDIECYILDMDGTIYLGEQVIQGAHEFLALLLRRNIPYYFFTNNSSKSPDDYIDKLNRLGFGTYERSRIITSFDVAADYIGKTYGCSATVYTVGTPSMEKQMSAKGFSSADNTRPDCVLVGFDTTFNFEKASRAVDYLRDGVPFLATNIDAVCPLEGGKVLPDCASICAMLTHATGYTPKYLGKPFAETAAYIAGHTGISAEKTAVIGDRLYTDMMLATKNGMCAIGVLSGEMTQTDIHTSADKPHFVFNSVLELREALLNDQRS
jgi:HAD superfamily hydrolase (TIGR01450 family)